MFSFFKKKQPLIVPDWADFFTEKEYSQFISEVEVYFKKEKIPFVMDDGVIQVDENAFDLGTLGLVNVAQVCKQDDSRTYQEIIKDHFTTLKRAGKLSNDFNKIINEFDLVKEHLGVRLYHEDFINHTVDPAKVVHKNFVGEIKEVLVFDLPESVQSITSEQAKKWNKDIDKLFEIGRQNIKSEYPLNVVNESFKDFEIWFANDDHFYVPNIVFDLKERPELIGLYGALIGIPHRHTAIIYPIDNLDVVKVINDLIPLIYSMNQEGPGSLSNQLLWYHGETFTDLPYEIADDKIQFFPPETFVDVLNLLGY